MNDKDEQQIHKEHGERHEQMYEVADDRCHRENFPREIHLLQQRKRSKDGLRGIHQAHLKEGERQIGGQDVCRCARSVLMEEIHEHEGHHHDGDEGIQHGPQET